MKDVVEFVGVIVKINGKRKVFEKKDCGFRGWEYVNEDLCEGDSGVILTLRDGRKNYKLDVEY